jgi:phosphatidylserine decarboxylase
MKKSKRTPRIHREGRGIIVGLTTLIFAINVPIYLFVTEWVFALTLLLSAALLVFVTYFFRNPVRILEVDDPNFLVAPADGRIVVVEPIMENEYFHEKRLQVSIFMSPFNVHANWFPVDGHVIEAQHFDGNFHKAWLPKAASENEHADILIQATNGETVLCRQIAGAMARRIVTYARKDDDCYIDEHLGFIKFGSRVDIFLPVDSEICVKMGQTTTGDQTIIARMKPQAK